VDRQTIRRTVIGALLVLLVGLVWLTQNLQIVLVSVVPGLAVKPTLGPTPPPPTIALERGDLPSGHAGLEVWAQSTGGDFMHVGSGFLLQLPVMVDGRSVVGVTTAHSLNLGGGLERLAFRLPQTSSTLVEFDAFHGLPGRAFTGYAFTADYVLLSPINLPPEAPLLRPDPRGGPQPGERVVLYSGLGDGQAGPRPLPGTVTASDFEAVWAVMDDDFDPSRMSGSPLLSAHTGLVVGMAVAASRGAPLQVGFHPIGSLIDKAEQAAQFPPLSGFRR
jgi:hypothetical protein